MLLAVGFWLKLSPYLWTYTLGILTLLSLAILCEGTVRKLVPIYHPGFPWIGTVLVFEWHLVWSAVSGMETLLFAFAATALLILLITGCQKYIYLGLLIGASIWIRPDGITLIAPVLLLILVNRSSWKKKLQATANLAIGLGSLTTLYLLFNLSVSGSPLPNTFYAKYEEYASYLRLPFIQRMGNEAMQPLIGVGVLLLPGMVLTLIQAIRRRNIGVLASVLWIIAFLWLYAWRLPVTYQHGRYVMPILPVFITLGLAGMVEYILERRQSGKWVGPLIWKLSSAIVLALFWGRGLYTYGQDVAVIESEMVTTARWVSAHIPADALVAAHDIGALGYFGRHNLVDLAGLVSPEVIPFLRNEEAIRTYLNTRGVTYLVIFPDWYANLTDSLTPVFETHASYAPALGELNMAVYIWPQP